ncbi:MAG: T9SS type A sorting domain-containing protein [candidate division WOR-3 bacterium]|nr:MAG: T9SS type A sorting domain-containing protein [candidate division WOR-3 bacterium]
MQRLTLVLTLLLAVGFAATEVVTFEDNWAPNPLFNMVSETSIGCELVFSMHQMVIEDQELDGVMMNAYGVPAVFLPRPGAPNINGASRYIAVPQGARVQVTVLDQRTEVIHGVEVPPAPAYPLEHDEPPLLYEKDTKIYNVDAFFPATPVIISDRRTVRGVDMVLVTVMPFQYNPVTKELLVHKDIRFRIDFVGGNGRFGEDRLRSRFWEPIFRNNLINYSSLPVIDFYAPERLERDGYEYVIIVPDDAVFEAWADTIKTWRKLQGISCEIYTLTEVGGSSATAIENFLNNAYSTWSTPPAAFLLLSDYPSSGELYGITSPMWDNYCVSDNIYADYDDDDLPDMHHGRICAQNEDQLSRIINKFLGYEREPYTHAPFYDNPLVACGWQDDRWFQLASEVVRGFLINDLGKTPAREYNVGSGNPYVGGPWSTRTGTTPVVAYWNAYGYVPLTNPYNYQWWDEGSAGGINDAINSGAFFIQHRDHGATYGWSEPNYGLADLNGLDNAYFTFVNSTNCLTGAYDYYTEVFAEKFYRIEYGAWGANAASEVSYSFVNDTYIWGMWDCLYPEFDPGYPMADLTGQDDLRPCMAMTSGKIYLHAMWFPDSVPGVSGYRVYTDHLFHHHGDCFTTLYSEMPQTLSVSHPATLLAGMTSFTVTANDGSVIALTVGGEIIGVAEGTGSPVVITISPQVPGTDMKVTVTKANYYRYDVDVPVVSGSYAYVTMIAGIIDDATGNGDGLINPGENIDFGVWAKNVGVGTADNIYGMLSESDEYVSIAVDSSWYGDIAQDDSTLSDPYYDFTVDADCPDGHMIDFTLEFYDSNDSIFISYPSYMVYAPVLTYEGIVVEGGNGDGILDPGETCDLVATLMNEGGGSATNVTSTLLCSSPYITINDDSGTFGTILPDSSATNAADPYSVTADSTTPMGTNIDFEIEVIADNYADTFGVSLVVGKKHYYLWNPDPTPTPGQNMHEILGNLGYSGDYSTSSLASDLSMYQSVIVCVGIYSNNYEISAGSPQASDLVDYLQDQNGRMYLEGGDVWYYDPMWGGYDFCSLFGINAVADGSDDLGPVVGETNAFTTGMNFNYGGENNWIDHINPSGSGFLIFHDGNDSYNCGVANDAGSYRTVGTSFELGLLTDGSGVSTRAALIDSIMKFFGIVLNPGVEENPGSAGLPMVTRMNALYPNPLVRHAAIRYQLASTEHLRVQVYDAAGRVVTTLVDEVREPGYYMTQWHGTDSQGRAVAAGVYFVRFVTESHHQVEKAILLR